jgi:FK506-binding protein 4/5
MSQKIDISGDGLVSKEILQEGVGEETPAAGCQISCHYTGKLLDGTKFDSSLDRNQPFEFELGKGAVIKSWDLCVASMKKGEKCLMTADSSYGNFPNFIPYSSS